ncbi:MAG: ATP-grasp domain-containing protein [Halioglobus sp.]|nr:ATP-grasp domain-containing protein [Halioglobus sp.]
MASGQAIQTTTGRTPRWLGIIGSGQLGMLLCDAARALDIRTMVLSDDPAAPAIYSADAVLVASMQDPRALASMLQQCDTITFEFEAVPDTTLERLSRAVARGSVSVHPAVATLQRLKDKGLQKTWLRESQLPTLPFTLTDADTAADELRAGAIQPPLVQKTRQGGYDGKGVQILLEDADLAKLWPVPGLIEPALIGCTEVAVVVARDTLGTTLAYPPVSMAFDDRLNAVSTVTYPAEVAPDIRAACTGIAERAVNALAAAGVFAVELFVTASGDIFINEISPRVHNAGHLTLTAFEHDQFEQHVRAVMGLPLAPIKPLAPAAVMLNLLYDDSMAPAHTGEPYNMELEPQVMLHWYGKQEARDGRKMGHITALGDSPTAALALAHAGLARIRSGELRPARLREQANAR